MTRSPLPALETVTLCGWLAGPRRRRNPCCCPGWEGLFGRGVDRGDGGHFADRRVEAVGVDQVGWGRGIDAHPVGELGIVRGSRTALTTESKPAGAGDR